MRKLFPILVVYALAIAGCAQVQDGIGVLSSPQAIQAAQNAERIVSAVSCGLSSAAAGAIGIQQQLNAAGQTVAAIVYASSKEACSLLGGASQGAASVPASAVFK